MKWDGKIGLALAIVVALFGAVGAPPTVAQDKKANSVFILTDT